MLGVVHDALPWRARVSAVSESEMLLLTPVGVGWRLRPATPHARKRKSARKGWVAVQLKDAYQLWVGHLLESFIGVLSRPHQVHQGFALLVYMEAQTQVLKDDREKLSLGLDHLPQNSKQKGTKSAGEKGAPLASCIPQALRFHPPACEGR